MSGEAPGGDGKTCPGCGGLGWIPAGDEQAGCIDCNGTGHAPAPPPRPAQDAVREAAERLRATLDRTCGKYLGGPRLPLVNDLEEHAARLLAAIDAAKGGE